MTNRTVRGPADAGQWLSRAFPHVVCISCLLLQRFGATLGVGQIFLCTLVVPLAVGFLLAFRLARVEPLNFGFFLLMFCGLFTSAIGGVLYPDPEMRFSLLSLIELGLIYLTLLPSPAAGFDTQHVLRILIFYLRLIAVAGLVEWALQFVGLKLFSFEEKASWLRLVSTEPGYDVVAPIRYGSGILRSNGFFLLEPAMLSQMMALAIVVDLFVRRRARFLPLYGAALLASYSGTGILALVIALALTGLTSPKQLPRIVLIGVVGVLMTSIVAVALPDQFSSLVDRASGHDQSGQLRFASLLTVMHTIANNARIVVGFGPGAADGYTKGIAGSMSPALKLFFDYGVIGLLLFVAYLVKLLWRNDARPLSFVCLVLFQVSGGTLVFAPWVFLFGLACVWSRTAPPAAGEQIDVLPPRSLQVLA